MKENDYENKNQKRVKRTKKKRKTKEKENTSIRNRRQAFSDFYKKNSGKPAVTIH